MTAAPTLPLVKALNRQQTNALVTYLNYKKYHWLTFGPLFRDLHLLFEEHATQVAETIDELAERSLVIEGTPVTDPDQYLVHATVKASSGKLSVKGMIEEALSNHDQTIGELHQDAEAASQAGDIGTADLYTRLVQMHQKQRWFLRELLRKDDGLLS